MITKFKTSNSKYQKSLSNSGFFDIFRVFFLAKKNRHVHNHHEYNHDYRKYTPDDSYLLLVFV